MTSALFDSNLSGHRAGRIVNAFLAVLIIVNVAAVILESVESIRVPYAGAFWWVEQIATAIFAVEYGLRVWSSVDRSNGQFRHPLWGRLRYATQPFALIDLLAVLPALLGVLGADDFRVLRVLRLLRMLKLTRHSTAFSLLWAVVREEARSIGAVLFILALLLIMSSSVMFMLENEAQPAIFSSIPASLWWAVETLTTVGYGDMVPVTPLGKILGGFVSVAGIGTLGLFSGVLTVSFMDQIRLRRDQYRHLVDQGVRSSHLTQTEIRAIEKTGRDLGVAANEADAMVEQAMAADTRPAVCPQCGAALAGPDRI